MRYSTDEEWAEVIGFDHPSAAFGMWGIVAGMLPWLAIPAFFSLPWATALMWTLVAVVAVFVLVLPLQYRIRVLPGQVVLERSWARLRYKRVVMPYTDGLEFIVSGTGDWGDEGAWPARHYCEIAYPGQNDLLVGTPSRAEELALWLSSQVQRVSAK